MNTASPQASSLRPLVSDASSRDERNLRDALNTLHDRNASLVAVEAFILANLEKLSGTPWSVGADHNGINGVSFYCTHPGDRPYSPDAPKPEDIARRFPGEWQMKPGYEGATNAVAKRDGIVLTISNFKPRPSLKGSEVIQTLTY